MFAEYFIFTFHSEKVQVPEQKRATTQSFSRTDKVLEDLHSGEIFKNMTPPKHTKKERKKSSSSDSSYSTKIDRQISGTVPSMVMVQSIVAYLGTVEMPLMETHMVAPASLDAVRGCVQRLRQEQHIHQRVLFKV